MLLYSIAFNAIALWCRVWRKTITHLVSALETAALQVLLDFSSGDQRGTEHNDSTAVVVWGTGFGRVEPGAEASTWHEVEALWTFTVDVQPFACHCYPSHPQRSKSWAPSLSSGGSLPNSSINICSWRCYQPWGLWYKRRNALRSCYGQSPPADPHHVAHWSKQQTWVMMENKEVNQRLQWGYKESFFYSLPRTMLPDHGGLARYASRGSTSWATAALKGIWFCFVSIRAVGVTKDGGG